MGTFNHAIAVLLILTACSVTHSCSVRPSQVNSTEPEHLNHSGNTIQIGQPAPSLRSSQVDSTEVTEPEYRNHSGNTSQTIGQPAPPLRSTKIPFNFARVFYERKRKGESVINLLPYYSGCGTQKGCKGSSLDCIDSKTCGVLVAWHLVPSSEYMQFEVFVKTMTDDSDDSSGAYCSDSVHINDRAYIALAFTQEESMDKAVVIECSMDINERSTDPKREAVMAWNADGVYRIWDYKCTEATMGGKVKNCQVDLDMNNHMTCEFRLKRRIVISQEIFHFSNGRFYMTVFKGCNQTEFHTKSLEKWSAWRLSNSEMVHLKNYRDD